MSSLFLSLSNDTSNQKSEKYLVKEIQTQRQVLAMFFLSEWEWRY